MNYLPQADEVQSVSSDNSNQSDAKHTSNETLFINYDANTESPITEIVFDINKNKMIKPYKSLINLFGVFTYKDDKKIK